MYSLKYLLPPDCHQVRTVADDEVVQQVRVEAGEGPADGAAPVVAHQSEPRHSQGLRQSFHHIR